MQKQGKLELTWVGKYEEHEIEPRILVEDPTKSFGDPNSENMLIHGDNLIALKALEQDFAGKIKCIYIDPPYNTGSAFEHYDDNLEHSIWLNLMHERLSLLKNLLTDDGVIYIQIDDNEQAYLKILCDEIFGRKNYVSTICVKMSTVSGVKTTHKEKTIIKEKEMVLVYCKNSDKFTIKPQYIPVSEMDSEFQYFLDKNDSENPDDWKVKRLSDVLTELKIEKSNSSEFSNFINKNADKIWRRAFIRNEYKEKSQQEPNRIFYVKKGESEHYYYRGREMFFLSEKIHSCFTEEGVVEAISNLLGDIWLDINTGKLFNEGNVEFRNSKKPEFLIARILEMSSTPGDYVLDSFLGSGTTAAVAHKMGRKWIGIELGEHAYTHCKVRLDKVIEGEEGGISKAVNWQGGGGYKFYELAPSLLVPNPKLPSIMQINPEYTFEQMCEAICKIEGFKYKPQGRMHGHSSEKRFIHITKEFVNAEYINSLLATLGEEQSVLIYGTKIQSGLRLSDNVEVKKIPKDLLDKCKFESEVR